jgi:hypothetical protein
MNCGERVGPPVRRQRLAARGDHGSTSIAAAILVPAVIVMVGLVYDGNGKVAAVRDASAAAVAAARAGGDASTSHVAAGRSPGQAAAAAARRSLSAQGVSGSVSVSGRTLRVQTTETYSTVFLQVVGIGQLQGHGEATARIAEVAR